MANNPRKKNRLRRRFICALCVAVVGLTALAVFWLPIYWVVGDSMAETLRDGDVIAAVRGKAARGAIAVCECGGRTLLGRIIALGGDTVLVSIDGAVLVNGRVLDELYLTERAYGCCDLETPVTVPEGSVFILSDHRAEAIDSRSSAVGCIPEAQVVGCVLARVWPIQDFELYLSIEQLWRA